MIPHIDFETFSTAGYIWNPDKGRYGGWANVGAKPGIQGVGTSIYAEHPSTQPLILVYGLDATSPEYTWLQGMPEPTELTDHIRAGGFIKCHGSFEWWLWNYICKPRYGWPELPVEQVINTMAAARAYGLPGALEKLGSILKVAEKDSDGKKWIRRFSIPRAPSKNDQRTQRTLEQHPDEAEQFIRYCIQDVRTETAVDAVVPPLDPLERQVYLATERINIRGVRLDLDSIRDCVEVIAQAHTKYNAELRILTGGQVPSSDAIGNLTEWVRARGVLLANLQKDTIKEVLERDDLDPSARRALEIRRLLSKSSIKKLYAMLARVSSDGRLRNMYNYCGATNTGRWTGGGVQAQNLSNKGGEVERCNACEHHHKRRTPCCPWCGATDSREVEWGPDVALDALAVISTRDLAEVERVFGEPLETISGCVRSMFIPADGHRFICADYSAIEAVVTAVLAGEQWRIDVFNTHGKIYEASASMITGIDLKEFFEHKKRTGEHHPQRNKIGKYAELASGFGGWLGAWKNFGADKHLSDDEIITAVKKWRAASPAVVELWGGQVREDPPGSYEFRYEYFGLEGAAIQAMLNPGKAYEYRGITYQTHGDLLTCKLPSGRLLRYHDARLFPSSDRFSKLPTWGLSAMRFNTDSSKGKVGWVRFDLWRGILIENVVQAIARDLLAWAIIRLEAAGYSIVMTTHDEVTIEAPEGKGSLEEVIKILCDVPAWARLWPVKIKADGWEGVRYRK